MAVGGVRGGNPGEPPIFGGYRGRTFIKDLVKERSMLPTNLLDIMEDL